MRNVGFAIIAYCAFSVALFAVQSKPAVIHGTVRDTAGHPFSGLEISLINKTTRIRIGTAMTNEVGEYRIEVTSGSYDICVPNGSFLEAVATVQLNANETIKRDLTIPDELHPHKPALPAEPKEIPERNTP